MNAGFMQAPAGWTITRVDRVASVNARIGWKALTAAEYQDDGYVFLATPNIKGSQIDFDNVNYISQYRYEESPELQLALGDVLLAKDGNTLGITNIIRVLPRPATVNGSIAVLRPRNIHPPFLAYAIAGAHTQNIIGSLKGGMGVPHLFQRDIKRLPVLVPPMEEQVRISKFLDAEVGKTESVVSKKAKLLDLLNERIDSRILSLVSASRLVNHKSGSRVLPIRRILTKVSRPPRRTGEIVTAYRDGQVTARSFRRVTGYTLPAATEAQGQYVVAGDVVVHGLDGFAGAIGTAQAEGNCSPVYHVCVPRSEGDPDFLGRFLRVLAISGYLGLFAISTRERAVDFRNWELFGSIPVPDVPINEQRSIGAEIRSMQPLQVAVERSNLLTEERRTALITAAVTGQIDVSSTTGRGTED